MHSMYLPTVHVVPNCSTGLSDWDLVIGKDYANQKNAYRGFKNQTPTVSYGGEY